MVSTTKIGYSTLAKYIKYKDVQRLKAAVYGQSNLHRDVSGLTVRGELPRATVIGIAVMPHYDRELIDLALDIAVPWVNPWELSNYIDIAVPYANIYTPDENVRVNLHNLERRLPQMAEDELLSFLRFISNGGADKLSAHVCDALARRVFELSRHSCLFKSGQRTLLVYASMIPVTDDVEDADEVDNVQENDSDDSPPVAPPYTI